MALYLYENPKTGEIAEIWQGMKEEHKYSKSGIQWNRIFTKPNAAINTQIDPFSKTDFVNKTSNKYGKMADLYDQSKEMSLKRTEKEGKDSVKEKYYENWAKTRRGKRHPAQVKEQAKKKFSNPLFEIE